MISRDDYARIFFHNTINNILISKWELNFFSVPTFRRIIDALRGKLRPYQSEENENIKYYIPPNGNRIH